MAGIFHTLPYPVNPGAYRSDLQFPVMAPGDRRTYVLDLSGFCDSAGSTISAVAPLVDLSLTLAAPTHDAGTVTLVVGGGDLTVPWPTIFLAVTLTSGDVEEITITQPVAALSPLAPSGTSTGNPLTTAFHPIDVSTLALLAGGAQAGDLALAMRAGVLGLVPAGAGGGSGYAPFVAAATISGHRALMVAPGGVAHADPSAPFAFAGISTQAASTGTPVLVAEDGQTIVEPSWSWPVGAPLFVGLNGLLTATPPTSGISQQVAVATAPTAILVQPFTPTRLS